MGGRVYTEPVVRTFSYKPCYPVVTAKHPLLFFPEQGEFTVGQIIANLLSALHAERDEDIPMLPFSDSQYAIELIRIKAGHFLFAWNYEIRCIFLLLFYQGKRGLYDFRR